MAMFRGERQAFGRPGIEPRWTHGSKDGVGTAYAASSRIWFTLWNGILTEVYYPTVDRPQPRDLQYFITDGEHPIRNVEALLAATDRDQARRALLDGKEREESCLETAIIFGGSSLPE